MQSPAMASEGSVNRVHIAGIAAHILQRLAESTDYADTVPLLTVGELIDRMAASDNAFHQWTSHQAHGAIYGKVTRALQDYSTGFIFRRIEQGQQKHRFAYIGPDTPVDPNEFTSMPTSFPVIDSYPSQAVVDTERVKRRATLMYIARHVLLLRPQEFSYISQARLRAACQSLPTPSWLATLEKGDLAGALDAYSRPSNPYQALDLFKTERGRLYQLTTPATLPEWTIGVDLDLDALDLSPLTDFVNNEIAKHGPDDIRFPNQPHLLPSNTTIPQEPLDPHRLPFERRCWLVCAVFELLKKESTPMSSQAILKHLADTYTAEDVADITSEQLLHVLREPVRAHQSYPFAVMEEQDEKLFTLKQEYHDDPDKTLLWGAHLVDTQHCDFNQTIIMQFRVLEAAVLFFKSQLATHTRKDLHIPTPKIRTGIQSIDYLLNERPFRDNHELFRHALQSKTKMVHELIGYHFSEFKKSSGHLLFSMNPTKTYKAEGMTMERLHLLRYVVNAHDITVIKDDARPAPPRVEWGNIEKDSIQQKLIDMILERGNLPIPPIKLVELCHTREDMKEVTNEVIGKILNPNRSRKSGHTIASPFVSVAGGYRIRTTATHLGSTEELREKGRLSFAAAKRTTATRSEIRSPETNVESHVSLLSAEYVPVVRPGYLNKDGRCRWSELSSLTMKAIATLSKRVIFGFCQNDAFLKPTVVKMETLGDKVINASDGQVQTDEHTLHTAKIGILSNEYAMNNEGDVNMLTRTDNILSSDQVVAEPLREKINWSVNYATIAERQRVTIVFLGVAKEEILERLIDTFLTALTTSDWDSLFSDTSVSDYPIRLKRWMKMFCQRVKESVLSNSSWLDSDSFLRNFGICVFHGNQALLVRYARTRVGILSSLNENESQAQLLTIDNWECLAVRVSQHFALGIGDQFITTAALYDQNLDTNCRVREAARRLAIRGNFEACLAVQM